ncbi:MAG: flavodoxin domain-containing protein [Polyangiaceae bacterium]
MRDRHILIVGGGLAGLSAGCYARAAGFRTTILEHNVALGGVCTAWRRGEYTIDGCIHWLTGGAFDRVYEELGILPRVERRTIETFMTYRDLKTGNEVRLTRDLDRLVADLGWLSRQDGCDDSAELARLARGARVIADLPIPIDAPEVATLRQLMARAWELKGDLGVLMHFRKPFGQWLDAHIESAAVRRYLLQVMPNGVPAFVLLAFLGFLERGYLSRPVGGTAAFRDALIAEYERLGGDCRLGSTVDEILTRGDRAYGVRLADGTELEGDLVISTSSAPETIHRLLKRRYGAEALEARMRHTQLFDPIVLASFGVKMPLTSLPSTLVFDQVEPLDVGGVANDKLYLRIFNDEPTSAPPGHSVVQLMLTTDYDYWAKEYAAGKDNYAAAKKALTDALVERLDALVPNLKQAIEVVDLATPITYWNTARSWRGAYEGWKPGSDAFFGSLKQTVHGVAGLYLAGQWVEPGGGVPTALASGRKVVQLVCADEQVTFVAAPSHSAPPRPRQATPPTRSKPVLILYATREGQTRRIAEHVSTQLHAHGFQYDLRDVKNDPPRSLDHYSGAILAASIHVQRHEGEMVEFVRRHRDELEKLPSAFLSVSMVEAGAEDPFAPAGVRERAKRDAERLSRELFERTHWHADRVQPVAGALAYTQYSPPMRLVMQGIAAANHGSTDASRDHQYTNWQVVDRFVAGFLEGREEERPRADVHAP